MSWRLFQSKTEPVLVPPPPPPEDSWHYPFSEPVRLKVGLRPGLQQFFAPPQPASIVTNVAWLPQLSLPPVLAKAGLQPKLQQFYAPATPPQPSAIVSNIAWAPPFNQPVMVKQWVKTAEHQVLITTPSSATHPGPINKGYIIV